MSKTIVIIGGGYAGITMALSLEKALGAHHRILLIEKKEVFYHSIAGLRASVVDIDDRVLIPYSNLFLQKHNQVLHGCVAQWDEQELRLESPVPTFGDRIQFDYLVIATGSAYPFPGKVQNPVDIPSQLAAMRQQIKTSKSVVIVGGGTCGIEMAGEIREVYPEKPITLIHSQDAPLSTSAPQSLRKKLDALLKKNHIDVIYNDSLPQDTLMTQKGKQLTSDLVLRMYPGQSTSYKVKPTFQLVDHPTHFALGDAADLDEEKRALFIPAHVEVTTKNIVALINSKEPTAHYSKGSYMMVVTFGSKQGAGYLLGLTVGSWFVSFAKSKNLFIDQYQKTLRNNKSPSNDLTLMSSSIIIAAAAFIYYYYFNNIPS